MNVFKAILKVFTFPVLVFAACLAVLNLMEDGKTIGAISLKEVIVTLHTYTGKLILGTIVFWALVVFTYI